MLCGDRKATSHFPTSTILMIHTSLIEQTRRQIISEKAMPILLYTECKPKSQSPCSRETLPLRTNHKTQKLYVSCTPNVHSVRWRKERKRNEIETQANPNTIIVSHTILPSNTILPRFTLTVLQISARSNHCHAHSSQRWAGRCRARYRSVARTRLPS
jgi:hypothetical protein